MPHATQPNRRANENASNMAAHRQSSVFITHARTQTQVTLYVGHSMRVIGALCRCAKHQFFITGSFISRTACRWCEPRVCAFSTFLLHSFRLKFLYCLLCERSATRIARSSFSIRASHGPSNRTASDARIFRHLSELNMPLARHINSRWAALHLIVRRQSAFANRDRQWETVERNCVNKYDCCSNRLRCVVAAAWVFLPD